MFCLPGFLFVCHEYSQFPRHYKILKLSFLNCFSQEYSSLCSNHIKDQAKLELANLDSIQVDLDRKKAELHMRLYQVSSYQNLLGEGK